MEAVTKSFIMRLPIVSRQDQCARGEGSKFEQWRRLVKAAICERLKSAWNELKRSSNAGASWRAWRTVAAGFRPAGRSEEHTSELQSLRHLVCRLLLEKKT